MKTKLVVGMIVTPNKKGVKLYPKMRGITGQIKKINPEENPYVRVCWNDDLGGWGFCHIRLLREVKK